ncbi:hypothetical protein BRD13_06835 [Halobacteriales archaeon SW_5_70_135]|nr:MAG: hypothetical protein BRD13_06835 [Halobacteriales archaeon SW_5_70_135]
MLAGMVATRAMDLAMARLPEGETPPRVASGVLTGRDPAVAPARLAAVVHHVAGSLTGGLFVTLLLFAEALLGVSPVAHAAAVVALYGLMVGFFALVPLPRADLPRERVRRVVRDWAVVAAVYLAVLVGVTWSTTRLLVG